MDTPASPTPAPRPKIAVLLATHNGRRWLPDQLRTILDQQGVDVRVIALDDESTDGTREWLLQQAAADARVTVMAPMGPSGSAVANFFRLIQHADIDSGEYVAFADQDDLWMPGKLAAHAAIIESSSVDGVSSNVTSFTAAGKRTLLRKNDPQRQFDYLLQSPGPGSTFLITPRLLELAREVLANSYDLAIAVDFHDSFLYVIARARGWRWHIDAMPSVDYRQHDDNVIGANVGVASALSRLDLIRSHWHRSQAAAMARVALTVAPEATNRQLLRLVQLFETRSLRSRWQLVRAASQFRRRPRDRWVIGALIALGIW